MSDAQTETQAKSSQVKANPTHATLDALDHERDLETQRQKRKDSSIIIDNPANEARKNASDDGDKQSQDVSDDYMFDEAEDQVNAASGEDNSGQEKSPLN